MAAMMNVLMATSRALSGLFDNDITGLVSVERASLQKSSRKKNGGRWGSVRPMRGNKLN